MCKVSSFTLKEKNKKKQNCFNETKVISPSLACVSDTLKLCKVFDVCVGSHSSRLDLCVQNVLLKMETARLLTWMNRCVSLKEAIPVKS